MARILAVTWDGGGNVPPMTGVAARLRDRGHRVTVLGHPGQRAEVERAGLAFDGYRHARPWAPGTPVSGLRWATGYLTIFSDPGPGRDVTDRLSGADAPDLVLVDCMTPSAIRAATAAGVPTVAMMHTFHRFVVRGWARGPVGAIAALRGLRPQRLLDGCARVVVATDRELDPATSLPPNVRHTGPVLKAPATGQRADPPLVLVSMSTIYYPAQSRILQNVLDGLSSLDVRVVVATGPGVDPASLRSGPGVEVHERVDHDAVMPTASLLIGHGGHATTLRALSHDLAVVVVPLDSHLDHAMIGSAVADAGAGRVLTATAGPERIRDTVRDVLADDRTRAAAAACGQRIRATDGAGAAADEIESVLAAAPA